MRYFFLLFALGVLLVSCDRDDFQQIRLADQTVTKPADGIGHYVFAATLPHTVTPGITLPLAMEWRTIGPVDPTARYALTILLAGPTQKTYRYAPSNNTVGEYHLSNWQTYNLKIPADFPAGTYTVAVGIESTEGESIVLGFQPDLLLRDGFYRIAEVGVE